ncbi:hypothetical protein BGW41_005895 [Actinomortierella wolfii]|nr:hypothetical protein BGW41_005895 [Actinomortierella wolfii]
MATLQQSASQVGYTHIDPNSTANPPRPALRHHRRSCYRIWPPSLEIKIARLSIDEGTSPSSRLLSLSSESALDTQRRSTLQPFDAQRLPYNSSIDHGDAMIQSAYGHPEQTSSTAIMNFYPDPAMAATDDTVLLPPLKRAPSFSSPTTSLPQYSSTSRQLFARGGDESGGVPNHIAVPPVKDSKPSLQTCSSTHDDDDRFTRIEFKPRQKGDGGGLHVTTSPEDTPHIHPLDDGVSSWPSRSQATPNAISSSSSSSAAAAGGGHCPATSMFSTSASMAIDLPLSSSLETTTSLMMDLVLDESEFGQDLFMRAPASRAASLVNPIDVSFALSAATPTLADTEPSMSSTSLPGHDTPLWLQERKDGRPIGFRHWSLDDVAQHCRRQQQQQEQQHHQHHHNRHHHRYSEADIYLSKGEHHHRHHHHHYDNIESSHGSGDSDVSRQSKRHQQDHHHHHRHHHHHHQHHHHPSLHHRQEDVDSKISKSIGLSAAQGETAGMINEYGEKSMKAMDTEVTVSSPVRSFDVNTSPLLKPISPPFDIASLTLLPSASLQQSDQLHDGKKTLSNELTPLTVQRSEVFGTPWPHGFEQDQWQQPTLSSLADPIQSDHASVFLQRKGEKDMNQDSTILSNNDPSSPSSFNGHMMPDVRPQTHPIVAMSSTGLDQPRGRYHARHQVRMPMMPVIVEGQPTTIRSQGWSALQGSSGHLGNEQDVALSDPTTTMGVGGAVSEPSSQQGTPLVQEDEEAEEESEEREAQSLLEAVLEDPDLNSDVPMIEVHDELSLEQIWQLEDEERQDRMKQTEGEEEGEEAKNSDDCGDPQFKSIAIPRRGTHHDHPRSKVSKGERHAHEEARLIKMALKDRSKSANILG